MQSSSSTQPTLSRSLGLVHIIVIGLGYMAPMAVFDTFGIVSGETDGHVPAAYIVTLIAILCTALSYGHMVRIYPGAGSAYTYAQKTFHPYIGFLVGWISLLDYLFLPMINALLTAIYLSAAFPNVPEWAWIVGFVLLITFLNIFRVNVSASVNTLLVCFQIATVLIFAALAIQVIQSGAGGGDVFILQPFFADDMSLSSVLTGASILCFSFLGFDAVSTLSEETKNPKKTIPRGILLIALIGGTLFTTASYFAQVLFPDVSTFQDPEAASPEIALFIGGTVFQAVFLAAALTSTLASGIASHVSASRLLYAMGRDNFLPQKWFGYVHQGLGTPLFNVWLIGILSLMALFLDLLTATSFINFGALTAFTFVNLSVIVHFIIKGKARTPKDLFRYLIIPLVGTSFIAFLWLNLEPHSLMLGLSWATVGLLYLWYRLKWSKQQVYEFSFEE
ncbi:APC family permease [Brevibacillus dissolubilis]|uniref:APC family permease n=1 Tax=Brevibacillus dissolubilis TaxID=1844116 RepID=UPI0021000059|nr:APC family permease [Brevibacillus dissolubilis]